MWLVNHTRFPKEDHLTYWARRDNKVTKGDRVEHIFVLTNLLHSSLKFLSENPKFHIL